VKDNPHSPWQSDGLERIAKKCEFAKNRLLGFTVCLEMVFNFLSFLTNCMLYPLFSGLLDLNGMNERNRSVLYDGAVIDSSAFVP